MKMIYKMSILELIFVAASIFYIIASSSPHGIYPINGMVIDENSFNFEIQNGESILLSRNMDFRDAIELKIGEKVNLIPGEYFWKVKGKFRESEVKSFIVKERVEFRIEEGKEKKIVNSGTVPFKAKNLADLSEFVVKVGGSKEIERGIKYEVEEK